jgi:RNA polymerase sigma-70 factor (ECF subfamily)
MDEESQPLGDLGLLIERLRAGDTTARDELISCTYEPLLRLARKMLKGFPGLHRWEDSDDVLQSSLLRLRRALEQVQPQSIRDFISLAAVQIRRQLLDLARHYKKEAARAARSGAAGQDSSAAGGPCDPHDSTYDPSRLAEWYEFHTQVENLPQREREVFDLHWYQGLPHAEVGRLLNVSEETARQRWRSARLKLHKFLKSKEE